MKSALITGISGQDGYYLSNLLLKKNYSVFGFTRKEEISEKEHLAKFLPNVSFINGDLTDLQSLLLALEISQPDEIYNLGAMSSVSKSWEHAYLTTDVNALGVLNLLEAMKKFYGVNFSSVKFYQASSSEIFGRSSVDLINENTPINPLSPYAISKAYAHFLTRRYREAFSLFACSGLLFNHESPFRSPNFVSRKISLNVAKIALGIIDHFEIGDISIRRDWGFAGDYVEAMWRMLQVEKPDDYVISTGISHSIEDFLKFAFNVIGVKQWQQYVKILKHKRRNNEIVKSVGDYSKAKKVLDWSPKINFETLVNMMVETDIKYLSSK